MKTLSLLISAIGALLALSGARASELGPQEPPSWVGKTFKGKDVSGENCRVTIGNDYEHHLFGDKVRVEVQVGAKLENWEILNHPLVGGNAYGRTLSYTYSHLPEGAKEPTIMTDEYWGELNVADDGKSVAVWMKFLGSKIGNFPVGGAGKGKVFDCQNLQMVAE